MTTHLSISFGQFSHQGTKESNQDSHGIYVPDGSHLTTKGIAVAISDGISSSDVSHIASQTSVRSFLDDYYCTSETWSTKTAAERVIQAHNSWLFAQNQRDNEFRLNKDRGYVCTLSTLIFKSNTAHLFHVGDSQICLLADGKKRDQTEVLTKQHRLGLANGSSYLSRAVGVSDKLEIDYSQRTLQVGDTYFLATDGVYDFVDHETVCNIVEQYSDNLDAAAQKIVETAIENGSDDNLTAQIACIISLPTGKPGEFLKHLNALPFPPALSARIEFDGYRILRDIHKSSRSHVLLAQEIETDKKVVIKAPSTEGRQNPDYVERFLMEEWIANRINNAHIVKPYKPIRQREYCYVATEYIEGQTLAQWMNDYPSPSLSQVRSIIEQIAVGLQALHRKEMLHQDLRPNNIMIDTSGTVKIIDLGSIFIFGVQETRTTVIPQTMPGTAQFLAPEYFLGNYGTKRSDIYSLACITYHMLCGRSPYGTAIAKALTRSDQNRLIYQSVLDPARQLPAWVDLTLKKALATDPQKRYSALSEFIQDLRIPNAKFIAQTQAPLIERDPVRVWQGVSTVLGIAIIVLLYRLFN